MLLIRASGESRQSGSAAGDFELWLDFHGVSARVLTNTLDALPELAARVQTPRNHCHTDGDLTYLDYFGSALAVYDRSRNYLTVESVDTHRLHEITYLSILSRVGELLERRGLHRLHALAVGRHGETALFMMDSGGGKSTHGLGFLRSSDRYELISEDSPLTDRRGRVHTFPLRFGVLPPLPEGIAEEHIYHDFWRALAYRWSSWAGIRTGTSSGSSPSSTNGAWDTTRDRPSPDPLEGAHREADRRGRGRMPAAETPSSGPRGLTFGCG
jgi:hypothetical protein